MFQSTKNRLQALLVVIDDILVGGPDEEDVEVIVPHPHQRTVRLRLERRAGTVALRPMHCLSPVRSSAQRARQTVTARP